MDGAHPIGDDAAMTEPLSFTLTYGAGDIIEMLEDTLARVRNGEVITASLALSNADGTMAWGHAYLK